MLRNRFQLEIFIHVLQKTEYHEVTDNEIKKLKLILIIFLTLSTLINLMDKPNQPLDIYVSIFHYLSQIDIYCLANTSLEWNNLINTHKLLAKCISLSSISAPVLMHIGDL